MRIEDEETTVEVFVRSDGNDPRGEVIEERVVRRRMAGGPREPGTGQPSGDLLLPPMDGGPVGGMMPGPATMPPSVMLGVRMRELDPVLATHLGLSPRKVSVLEDVAEELNGHAGGLRDHDIVIAVDGSDDASPSHVRKVLRSKKPGDTMAFKVRRPGGETEVTVTLEPFDVARFHSATPARVGG